MKPILKWVGGKSQLINEIKNNLPKEYNDYYEPFIGGGAVLLNLEPQKAYANDSNTELINVYKQIKIRPNKLIALLIEHQKNHCKEYYYQMRMLDREENDYSKLNDLDKAARFIYLNKTCYNGLYRVNRAGQFNTPMGSYKNPNICNEELIKELSNYFHNSQINFYNKDFEKFLNMPKEGDFVYLDPPYHPISKTASFTAYQNIGFTKEDQIRLKKVCDSLNERGVMFMLSNSDADFINELYQDYKIVKVKAKRNINSKGSERVPINEVLVMNY